MKSKVKLKRGASKGNVNNITNEYKRTGLMGLVQTLINKVTVKEIKSTLGFPEEWLASWKKAKEEHKTNREAVKAVIRAARQPKEEHHETTEGEL